MAIVNLVKKKDPILRQKTSKVSRATAEMFDIIENLKETMYEKEGVGLAAPQIGSSLRIFVIDPFWGETGNKNPKVFINPKIQIVGDKTDIQEEGCLSLPDKKVKVKRFKTINVQWDDPSNPALSMEEQFNDFEARVIQHEFDHLNGILITDHEYVEGIISKMPDFYKDVFKRVVKDSFNYCKEGDRFI